MRLAGVVRHCLSPVTEAAKMFIFAGDVYTLTECSMHVAFGNNVGCEDVGCDDVYRSLPGCDVYSVQTQCLAVMCADSMPGCDVCRLSAWL